MESSGTNFSFFDLSTQVKFIVDVTLIVVVVVVTVVFILISHDWQVKYLLLHFLLFDNFLHVLPGAFKLFYLVPELGKMGCHFDMIIYLAIILKVIFVG